MIAIVDAHATRPTVRKTHGAVHEAISGFATTAGPRSQDVAGCGGRAKNTLKTVFWRLQF
jgi:hypothetical protein